MAVADEARAFAQQRERSVAELIANVAAVRPSSVALATPAVRLSYAELMRRANGLAAEIAHRARDPAAPVAVLLEDRAAMITAMIAVWAAGRICVPLDPALPPSRVATILRHSESVLVVTERSGSAVRHHGSGGPIAELMIDEPCRPEPNPPAREAIAPDSLACIVYTSGSMGEPKGLVRRHSDILHRLRCSITSLELAAEDRICALHAPTAGAGLRDTFGPLAAGAALLPFDLRHGGFGALRRWMEDEGITVLSAVVSTLRQMLASLDAEARFPSVRLVRTGSEPLYRRDVDELRRHVHPDCVIVTSYGATEANGIVEYRIDPDTELPSGRIPAGYPLDGVEIVLRDEEGNPVPRGEPGEVTVRSPYLSWGYWRQPELTRSVFELDPSQGEPRTYRTGDIGRLSADGCLEVLGRKDQQVKVRGYRVHPGEIELALAEHPSVRHAVVAGAFDADGGMRLVAYVVPQSSPAATAALLQRHLEARLPRYMIPATYVTLDAVPLTANGKVDLRALPAPPARGFERASRFIAPRSPTEHQLALIWERIFGVSPIGAEDDFFELGGDSLLAASLVSAVEDTFGQTMSPSLLLQAPTVATLAEAIAGAQRLAEPLTPLRATGGRAPIFFLHNDAGRGLYTQGLARRIDADRPFYAVHRDAVDTAAVLSTIEDLAADRIRAIRSARPHGPYVLGGHCRGGLVALEMARQLQAEGEEVDLVIMVDTTAPAARLPMLRHGWNAAGWRCGRALRDLRNRFDFALRVSREIRWRARYYGKRVGALATAGIDAQVDFARRKLRAREDGGAGQQDSPWRFYAEPPRRVDPRESYRLAYLRYVPSRYSGRVALFRAEQFPFEEPDLGWSRYLPRLEVVVVPGDHHSCITRHVTAFAAHMNAALSEAGRE